MRKKIFWKIILISILTLLLTGCESEKRVVDNPLSEEEIIKYAQERIYEETGDDVIVEIVSKKQMQVANLWFDGPVGYQDVEGGHEYELKITSAKDKNIVSSGYYKDGYITYDGENNTQKYKSDAYFGSNYVSDKGFYQVKTEFNDALRLRFDEYYIYEDIGTSSGLDVFICSTDYDLLDDLLLSFRNTVETHRDEEYVTYSVYIYNDREVFNNTNFDKYKDCTQSFGGQSLGDDILSQMTGKEVVNTAICRSFDRDFFESYGAVNAYNVMEDTNPDSYEYVIFYYDAEPNSFVGANDPSLCILGVKKENSADILDNNEEQDINGGSAMIEGYNQNAGGPLKEFSFSSEEDFIILSDEDVFYLADHYYITADFIKDFNADPYDDFGTPLDTNERFEPVLLDPGGVRSDYDVNKRISDEDFNKLVEEYMNGFKENFDNMEIKYYGATNNYTEYGYKVSDNFLGRRCFYRNTFMMSDTVDGNYYGGPYYLGELTTNNVLLEEDFYLSSFDNMCVLYRRVEEREDSIVYIYYYTDKKTSRGSWETEEGNNQKAEIWKNEVYYDKETHRKTQVNTLIRSVEIPDAPMNIYDPV